MQEKSITELNEKYNLELNKIINNIKSQNPKNVLLQFPDGLKTYATSIVNYLEKTTKNTNFIIWSETCFGACDTPIGLNKLKPKIDLFVQFGHNDVMPRY